MFRSLKAQKEFLQQHGSLTRDLGTRSKSNNRYQVKLALPLIGYKKVYFYKKELALYRQQGIAVLKIPVGAKIICGDDKNFKLRASIAKVLDVWALSGDKITCLAFSSHDNSFKYPVGKIVKPDGGFDERYITCGSGIHFFLDRREAEVY